MRIVPLTPFHKEWVQTRTQHPWVEDTVGVVALNGARVVGAAVLDSITKTSANVHFCADSSFVIFPLAHNIASGAFEDFGLEVIFAGIPTTNAPAIRLASKLGFTAIGNLPDAVDKGIGRLIMTLTPEACFWFNTSEEVA